MPSEKFNTYDEVYGTNKILEVVWGDGEDGPEAYIYAYRRGSNPNVRDLHVFSPDREDLNRLIRTFRRVRNAVYGADE